MHPAPRPWLTPLAGGLLGAVLFLATLGPAIVRPDNLGWVMRHDTQTYLLAWHHFRREPWQWPPGKVLGVGHPVGTSIGNSDAIPLVALPLKPFQALLPDPAQYLGAWLLACFALQGVFGALLVRTVSADPALQVLGAGLFVQTPALLHRHGHVALCAHWLLLAAIWIAVAHPVRRLAWRIGAWTLVSTAVAATQPYLAVMVLALAAADLASDALADWRAGRAGAAAMAGLLPPLAGTAIAMWLGGLFLVSSSGDLELVGLGNYSMNLLSPVIAMGYSSLLPAIPVATPGQYEGLVYFGAGWLALAALALVQGLRGRGAVPALRLGWIAVAVLLVYAVSPVVTAGSAVLVDLTPWTPSLLSVFRSSGRFAWLAMYVAFLTALLVVARALPRRSARFVVAAALVLQTWDLHGMYWNVHLRASDPAWITWDDPLKSAAWDVALPHYRHLVTVPPDMCVGPDTPSGGPHLPFSLRAGTHGLTMNSGFAGRYDKAAVLGYCAAIDRQIRAGDVSDDTFYVLTPALRDVLTRATRMPLVCAVLDGFPVCISEASYARWRTDGERAGFVPAAP